MRPSRALATLRGASCGALLLAVGGCAHTMRIETEPQGAEVVMGDVVVGSTPFTWEEPLGSKGHYQVSLRQGAIERTVLIERGVFSWSGVLLGGGWGCIGCTIASAVALPLGCVLSGLFPLGEVIPLALGGAGLLMLPLGVGLGYYLASHHGPDLVRVDLRAQQLQTEPPGLARLLRDPAVDPPPDSGRGDDEAPGAVYGY